MNYGGDEVALVSLFGYNLIHAGDRFLGGGLLSKIAAADKEQQVQ